MFCGNKKIIVLGRVVRELRIVGFFTRPRWRWKRVFFRRMRLDIGKMLNAHIIVTGESGSGKSSACKNLLGELSRLGISFAVFDAHDEYLGVADALGAEAYDASNTGINLFDIAGKSDREKSGELASMFRRLLRLGEIQSYVLYKAIAYTYAIANAKGKTPSMHELLFTIKIFERHARGAELNVLRTLEHRLTPITMSSFSRNVKVEELLSKKSVFAMGRLGASEAQAVYIESFLRKIYETMLRSGKSGAPRFVIVVEEAGRLVEGSMLARITAEGRKYGIGVITVAQRAKSLDKETRANAEVLIAFYQREPEELNYVANMIAGGNELDRFAVVKKALRSLGRGYAIVVKNREEPVVVKMRAQNSRGRSLAFEIVKASRNAIRKQELYKMLEGLGFDSKEAEVCIKRLVESKTLKYYTLPGTQYQGTWYISMQRNSAEHDVMVNLISRHLAGMGISNTIYNSAYGPDIIAYRDGKKIAVEYETGLKNPEDTRRMLDSRRGKYSETIVVTKDSCSTINRQEAT